MNPSTTQALVLFFLTPEKLLGSGGRSSRRPPSSGPAPDVRSLSEVLPFFSRSQDTLVSSHSMVGPDEEEDEEGSDMVETPPPPPAAALPASVCRSGSTGSNPTPPEETGIRTPGSAYMKLTPPPLIGCCFYPAA